MRGRNQEQRLNVHGFCGGDPGGLGLLDRDPVWVMVT